MKWQVLALLTVVSGCECVTVNPGERGILVNWGKIQEPVLTDGLHTCGPGSDIVKVSTRSVKHELDSGCFSSDLQQVNLKVAIIYRIPESKVISIFRDYKGDPFDVLVAPRAQEALKEATASRSAEHIVKDREQVKKDALEALKAKVGDALVLEDVIIENIDFSAQLKQAIENKMVQEQEAAKAKFTKQKAEIDAEIAITKAKGEADAELLRAETEAKAIQIRGDALSKNPGVVQLELINKWNGVSPQFVSGSNGPQILLPALK